MRDEFRNALAAAEDTLAELADGAAAAIERATVALLEADLTAAKTALEQNQALRTRLAELESNAYHLLALQAPVASDLRVLVTVVRLGANIERMGSLAAHVAETAERRHPASVVPDSLAPVFRQMGEVAREMAVDAAAALRSRDTEDAARLASKDDTVDRLRLDLFRQIAGDWPHGAEAAADAALLGRYYERFADHAVAIADAVVYLVTGVAAEA
ncbi:phosphate signaling complex protein PhoU [Cryptosporangium aurantiacum]|uniref:Phosphate-specific transport system accessory protein PhoU n=1 Tax=Cryptosporangium aurantiacum TaxID=134849 RepID=A0A1M7RHB7_9ACTN|nr:phosphate signaling complex protein PhoU [Cryptosporangium aurantiacum]SHN45683.1 phosphate transport system protein [Cryptosporangium aurantiacum]